MIATIGIDPGKTGALAIHRGNSVEVHDIEYIGKDLSIAWLTRTLEHVRDIPGLRACIEAQQVFPAQGAVSAFTIGEGYGMFRGWLAGAGVSYFTVRPAEWKKAMGIPVKSDKSISRMVAARLFPDIDLGRRADQGRAEALLLAEYAQRMYATASAG